MNIVYLEHYAGSDRHGMEYRPFYLARRWAQAGDTVTIVASSFSHLRGVNPDLGDKPWAEENIDGVRYFWIRGPRYEGNGLGRIRNMLSFLRGVSPLPGGNPENREAGCGESPPPPIRWTSIPPAASPGNTARS